MERFNYPSLAAARAEGAEILALLEAASYGVEADEREKQEDAQREAEYQARQANAGVH